MRSGRRVLPPRLGRGDTVGVVSPSWGGAGLFPHQLARGLEQLRALGFEVQLGSHALNNRGFVSDTPENRASDLHEFFADDRVKLIVAAIGGDHACHLLPHLDFSLIERYPTAFIGFSDNTVLNVALWTRAGLATFNGPSLLTDFGEPGGMFDYTKTWFLRALCEPGPLGVLLPSPSWTELKADWELPDGEARPRALLPSPGWTFLKPGIGVGRLLGGCLESLQHLRGTPFWPDWTDAILFFETSEQRPLPKAVDSMLMDYENMGVFSKLRGLLVGRPMHYSEEQRAELRRVVLARTAHFDFPVVTDMDFGHTAPQLTLPLGCMARIDSERRSVEVLESCTSE